MELICSTRHAVSLGAVVQICRENGQRSFLVEGGVSILLWLVFDNSDIFLSDC